MKIELKSIKFSESLSEETNAFTANLYIDGKKVGYCRNDGRGGDTMITNFKREDLDTIKKADEWCRQNLEPHTYKVGEETREIPISLEFHVNLLLEKWLKKKDEQKMKRKFKTCIVIGKSNSLTYSYWNLKKPLENFPKQHLQKFIDETVKPQLTDEKEILNDNLESLGILY